MYYYYVDSYNEFLQLMDMKEDVVPNIEQMNRSLELLRTGSILAKKQKASKDIYETFKQKARFGVRD